MTELQAEQEWLAGDDPGHLFDMLRQPAYPRVRGYNERKYRLWACACCRRIWHLMTLATTACREAVELAECYADDEIPIASLKAAAQRLEYALGGVSIKRGRKRANYCAAEAAISTTWSDFSDALRSRRGPAHVYVLVWDAEYYKAKPVGQDATWELKGHSERALSGLLRDIFGNPFRPVTVDPSWLTSTVLELASQMYESRDFSAMPIIADALQDAGCANEDLLTHCRSEDVHVRGCWVIDRLLGKE